MFNKFIVFIFLIALIIPKTIFSASEQTKTIQPAFWGSYSDPDRDQKHAFVSSRYAIVETGMGKSKIAQITNSKILRYFKIRSAKQ